MFLLWLCFSLSCALCPASGAERADFVHPGVLLTAERIAQINDYIRQRAYPVYEGFLLLESSPRVGPEYEMKGPYPYISRDHPDYKYTMSGMSSDFSAAYENALMWVLTREEAYAEKSVEILSAYASTLQGIPESNDRPLLAGLEGFKIVCALELLAHTWPDAPAGWADGVEAMLKTFFLPVLDAFYETPAYTNGNWGLIVTKAYMAMAILFDDTGMYDRAKDFYLNGDDNGTIRNYVDGETGQLQESGRDQQHSMLGISSMAMICEMAWQQGDDLYGLLDNRFMRGCEYVARYNLGYDVPYKVWTDVTGKYSGWLVVSEEGRGLIRPVFEAPFNHYVHRKGLEMPYTEELLRKSRPEGACNEGDFGSLLFYEAAPLPSDPEVGHLDYDFSDSSVGADAWEPVTSGARITLENGQMVVHCARQADGSFRGDFKLAGRTLLDGRNWPVFAVRIQGAEANQIAVDTERGPYGNGYGKWTGRLGEDVYYCDMRTRPFGESSLLGAEDLWELSRFGLKVAGLAEESYRISWFKTFRDVKDLESYVTGVETAGKTAVSALRHEVRGGVLFLWDTEKTDEIRLYALDGRLLCRVPPGVSSVSLPGDGVFILSYVERGMPRRVKLLAD